MRGNLTQAHVLLNRLGQQLDQGQISLPALLAVQQALLQTSLARVQAQASRLSNAVALYQALGGGWWHRKHDEAEESQHHHYPHVKYDLPGEFRNQVEKVFHHD